MNACSLALIAVVAVGCGRSGTAAEGLAGHAAASSAPTPTGLSPTVGPRPPASRSADVTVAAQAPFAITSVERLDAEPRERDAVGAFELAYTVKPRIGAPDQPDVRARVTCRIHEHALVVEPPPEVLRRTADETRFTTYFRPDPFAVEPADCEIAFQYRGESVGKACLRRHAIFDGSCSDDRLGRTVAGLALTESELHVRDGTLAGSAVVTVDAERTGHAAWARCEDGGRVVASREATPVPALDGMPAGTSKYVQLTADLAERLEIARGRCELGLVAAGGEQVARFCVANHRAYAGPCAPSLGTP